MAKADWVNVSPTSGSGDKSVSVSSTSHHTGRVARSTVLTITAANVDAQTVSVNQAGKPAYVDAQETAAAEKGGQNVTISGKANGKKLTFTLGTGNLQVSLPANYTAAGASVANGAEITGDPGASAEYDFSIVLVVPQNTSIEDISRQIIVTDESGNSDVCTLTQAAGDAYLTVSKTTIELAYTGESVSFDISSNTSWTIK